MKLIFVANAAFTLLNFRRELMLRLVSLGYEVFAVCPPGCDLTDKNIEDEFKKLGVRYLPVDFQRNGLNIVNDIRFFVNVYKLFRELDPDIVLNYTIKPFVYSSIAAKLHGNVKVLSNVTGLGYIFTVNSMKVKLLRILVVLQLKIASKCNDFIFFQNPDDLADYSSFGILSKKKNVKVINGSGVNLKIFTHRVLPDNKAIRFLFIARLIKDKGIYELLEASKLVKDIYPDVVIDIVGPLDSNPSALTGSDIEKLQSEGIVNYHGATSDVRPYLNDCDVFILPSYREGTPKTILEAMAIGRPIVTTDAPGCRECVVDGYNGFLVPVESSIELYNAMIKLIESPELRSTMGDASRQIAESKYDVNIVVKDIIDEIERC